MSKKNILPSGRLRNQRGITFLELMISVVIIGLVAAMAGPRFTKEMERAAFRASARGAISMIRKARSYSITDKQSYGVNFDISNATVTLFKDKEKTDPPTFTTGDSVISVDSISGDYSYLAVTLTAPLIFNTNGSASETGDIYLINYTYDGSIATTNYAWINVLAATGRTKMMDLQSY